MSTEISVTFTGPSALIRTLISLYDAQAAANAPAADEVPAPAADEVPAAAAAFAPTAATPWPIPAPDDVEDVQTAPPAPLSIAAQVQAAGAASVERDIKGVPYDARIHASTKVKIADGTWRQKRGVDPALVAAVMAEIAPGEAIRAAPVAAAAVVPAPAQAVPVPPPTVANVAPPAPPVPVVTSPVMASAGVAPTAYPSDGMACIDLIVAAKSAGQITQEQINAALPLFGVGALAHLIADIPTFHQLLAALRIQPA